MFLQPFPYQAREIDKQARILYKSNPSTAHHQFFPQENLYVLLRSHSSNKGILLRKEITEFEFRPTLVNIGTTEFLKHFNSSFLK